MSRAEHLGNGLYRMPDASALNAALRTADGLPVDEVELDLRIRVGEENSPAVQKILEWARFWEVDVNVRIY